MRANALKAKWQRGEVVRNGWLTVSAPYLAEFMGHQGFDSLTIDLQHGMIGIEGAIAMLQAISATPAIPLARVQKSDPALVMHLLDAGAYGIICPSLSTVEEVEEFVSSCRYPPVGQRSFGPARGVLYGGSDYAARADAEILAIAMIETRAAVENIEAIMSVPELDGVYVGPFDLAYSLGTVPSLDPQENEAAAALKRIAQVARQHGKFVGTHAPQATIMAARLKEGYNMLTPGNELNLLGAAARAALAQIDAGGTAST